MRIRTIKPEFWIDEKIGKLSRDARLLFIGLWSVCDDFGVCQSNFEFLKGQLFSYDKIPSKKVGKWIDELLGQNLIVPFETKGNRYFHIKHFNKHQVISRPSKFRNPSPPTLPEQSVNGHGIISDGGVMVMEGRGNGGVMEVDRESEGKEEQPKVTPPSLSKGEEQNQNSEQGVEEIVNTLTEKFDSSEEGHISIAKRRAFLESQKKELGLV